MPRHSQRGDRPPAVLIFYLRLLLVSATGGLTAVISLLGIRSRRDAVFIIPFALLGAAIATVNVLFSLYAYALTGRNMAG